MWDNGCRWVVEAKKANVSKGSLIYAVVKDKCKLKRYKVKK